MNSSSAASVQPDPKDTSSHDSLPVSGASNAAPSPPLSPSEVYTSKVIELAKLKGVPFPKPHATTPPRFFFADKSGASGECKPMDLMALLHADHASLDGVLLIQNIDPEWIGHVGSADQYGIEPAFFVGHASNEKGEDFPMEPVASRSYNLSGTFEFDANHRPDNKHIFSSKNYFTRHIDPGPYTDSIRMTTRISYGRINDHLCLILVDALPEIKGPGMQWADYRVTLRMPYAGGIVLPRVNKPIVQQASIVEELPYDLFDAMKGFLRQSWLLRLFRTETRALQVQPFLYLLSSSLWQMKLRCLEEAIQAVSFDELRLSPSLETNNRLHVFRRALATLVDEVTEIKAAMPTNLSAYYARSGYTIEDKDRPLQKYSKILYDAEGQQKLLMDTFSILMSTLSVKDSQTSIQQARRGTLLTVLALVYVPLSFVTGIFGMNIKEINGSTLDIWVCFATLAAIVVGTAFGFAVYYVARYGREDVSRLTRAFASNTWRFCIDSGDRGDQQKKWISKDHVRHIEDV